MSKSIYISIFLFLTTISSCSSEHSGEQSNNQTHVRVGSFKFQANTQNKAEIFNATKYAAHLYNYKLKTETDYHVYTKDNYNYVMFFTPTEGWDCYILYLDALNDKLAKKELNTFENIVTTVKERLGNSITYIERDKCPPRFKLRKNQWDQSRGQTT